MSLRTKGSRFMSENLDFRKRVAAALARIDNGPLVFRTDEVWTYEEIYRYVETYAYEKELFNTALALPLVRAGYDGLYRGKINDAEGNPRPLPFVYHCLFVCRMLIDLHVPLESGEEDILCAAALTHELIGHVLSEAHEHDIVSVYGLDERVYETVKTMASRDYTTEEDHLAFYRGMREHGDKLAMLVKLTDCSSVVERLGDASIWRAKGYIYQTRTYYLPMCVYAKERFPELLPVMNILMEKMRSLVEATEILVTRYEERSMELRNELLALRDENARIRGILRTVVK